MDIQADLLGEIDSFLARREMAETTFGRLAVNDGKFVKRLRDGGNITITTVNRVRAFIADHPTSPAESGRKEIAKGQSAEREDAAA